VSLCCDMGVLQTINQMSKFSIAVSGARPRSSHRAGYFTSPLAVYTCCHSNLRNSALMSEALVARKIERHLRAPRLEG
jgi:hypothetical protein